MTKHEPSFLMANASRFARKGQFEDAIDMLTAGVMKYPRDARMHSRLGQIYNDYGHRLFDRSIPSSKGTSSVLYRFGALHGVLASDHKKGDYEFAFKAAANLTDLKEESAMIYALRAIDLDNGSGQAWYFLGKIFHGLQDNGFAAACYYNTLRMQPGHRKAHERLEELRTDPGRRPPFDMEPYRAGQRRISGLAWTPFQLITPKP